MGQLRVVKSDAEVACMRKAGQKSGRAFTAAMRRSWGTERGLHAFLDHNFKLNGCEEEAYEPVVASGMVTDHPPSIFSPPRIGADGGWVRTR
jgi:intermediate cleaving peptidase 55